jgi:hypothetical protein
MPEIEAIIKDTLSDTKNGYIIAFQLKDNSFQNESINFE